MSDTGLLSYSALRNSDRPPLKRLLPLDVPLSIYIEPTNVCNFRCKCCPRSLKEYHSASGGNHMLDMKVFTRLGEELACSAVTKVVRFYMVGEPLLNKNLPLMIEAVKSAGISRTELTTNGTLLEGKMAHKLVSSGLDYIRVSIYSIYQWRNRFLTDSFLCDTNI